MAFPTLNMLSFWTAVPAFILMVLSFFVPGGAASGGWTSYAPLTAVPQYVQTGGEWGINLWCISLFILGFSSLMGSINYITTLINMRAPGMTWFRLPLVIWSLFIVAVLLLLALPVLTSALAMLLFDRVFGTHFLSRLEEVSHCYGNTCSGSLAIPRSISWCSRPWVSPRKSCRCSCASRSLAIGRWSFQ